MTNNKQAIFPQNRKYL